MRYFEDVALSKIDTETVADILIEMYSRIGFPEEILGDLGMQFVPDVMKEGRRLISVKQLTTTSYHLVCNELVEKWNGTLKKILKTLWAE